MRRSPAVPRKWGPGAAGYRAGSPCSSRGKLWVSAFAGMTEKGAGTDVEFAPLASMMRFDLDDNYGEPTGRPSCLMRGDALAGIGSCATEEAPWSRQGKGPRRTSARGDPRGRCGGLLAPDRSRRGRDPRPAQGRCALKSSIRRSPSTTAASSRPPADGFARRVRPGVVDALRCAAEAQTAMAESNAPLRPDQRIEFRIGINVGDIVVEGRRHLWRRASKSRPASKVWPNRAVFASRPAFRRMPRGRLDLAFEGHGRAGPQEHRGGRCTSTGFARPSPTPTRGAPRVPPSPRIAGRRCRAPGGARRVRVARRLSPSPTSRRSPCCPLPI